MASHYVTTSVRMFKNAGTGSKTGVSAAFQLSRLMGLLPYSAEPSSPSPGRLKFTYSNRWAAYSAVVVTSYTIIVAAINYDYVEGGKRRGDDWITNTYNLLLYLAQIGLQGLTLVVHLYMVTIRKKELAAIFRSLSGIRTGTVKPVFTTGAATAFGILWVVGCYMAWLVIGSSDKVPWFVFICPMISDVICLVVVMQFCAVVSSMETGFARVTAALKAGGPLFAHPLMTQHSLLMNKAVSINKFYSKQLLAVMSLAVINYIGWTYFAVQSVLTDEPDYLLGGSQFQMAIYQIFLILYTCRSCSLVTHEAASFNDELYNVSSRYPNMGNKVKVNLYISLRQTVHFTGCGFFTLNYPLVSSILGTATTYIVILIQFSMQQATASLARKFNSYNSVPVMVIFPARILTPSW